MATLLIRATLTVSGDPDDYEQHDEEIDDLVQESLQSAVNFIAAQLGKMGIQAEVKMEV